MVQEENKTNQVEFLQVERTRKESTMESKNREEEDRQNLWIFGDSYSYKWELPAPYKDSGQHDYTKYFFELNGKFPTHFSDVLNKEYNFSQIHNLAVRGADNYTILEIVGKHINNIKPNDFVVVGWSEVSRYRLVWNERKAFFWYRMYPNTPDDEWKKINKSHPIHILNRDSSLPYKEIQNWQNILLKALPENTIFWTPFWSDSMMKKELPFLNVNHLRNNGELTTINEETNGEQTDTHFGSNALESVGKWMITKFKDNIFRNERLI